MILCNYVDCSNVFEPTVHNQRYCSTGCTIKANNGRAAERNAKRKMIKSDTQKRVCRYSDCDTILGKWNVENACISCQRKVHNSYMLHVRNNLFG